MQVARDQLDQCSSQNVGASCRLVTGLSYIDVIDRMSTFQPSLSWPVEPRLMGLPRDPNVGAAVGVGNTGAEVAAV